MTNRKRAHLALIGKTQCAPRGPHPDAEADAPGLSHDWLCDAVTEAIEEAAKAMWKRCAEAAYSATCGRTCSHPACDGILKAIRAIDGLAAIAPQPIHQVSHAYEPWGPDATTCRLCWQPERPGHASNGSKTPEGATQASAPIDTPKVPAEPERHAFVRSEDCQLPDCQLCCCVDCNEPPAHPIHTQGTG